WQASESGAHLSYPVSSVSGCSRLPITRSAASASRTSSKNPFPSRGGSAPTSPRMMSPVADRVIEGGSVASGTAWVVVGVGAGVTHCPGTASVCSAARFIMFVTTTIPSRAATSATTVASRSSVWRRDCHGVVAPDGLGWVEPANIVTPPGQWLSIGPLGRLAGPTAESHPSTGWSFGPYVPPEQHRSPGQVSRGGDQRLDLCGRGGARLEVGDGRGTGSQRDLPGGRSRSRRGARQRNGDGRVPQGRGGLQ